MQASASRATNLQSLLLLRLATLTFVCTLQSCLVFFVEWLSVSLAALTH